MRDNHGTALIPLSRRTGSSEMREIFYLNVNAEELLASGVFNPVYLCIRCQHHECSSAPRDESPPANSTRRPLSVFYLVVPRTEVMALKIDSSPKLAPSRGTSLRHTISSHPFSHLVSSDHLWSRLLAPPSQSRTCPSAPHLSASLTPSFTPLPPQQLSERASTASASKRNSVLF